MKSKYYPEQRSYGCVAEDDIKEIVHDIIKTSPNVEAHIYADITIAYPEGNYMCVDMDYVYGKTNTDSFEEHYADKEEADKYTYDKEMA